MLGGIGKKAHYYYGVEVGKSAKLLYLDPHKVSDQEHLESYSCKQIHLEDLNDIENQFAVCYYISSASSLSSFKNKLDEIQLKYKQSCSIIASVRKRKPRLQKYEIVEVDCSKFE